MGIVMGDTRCLDSSLDYSLLYCSTLVLCIYIYIHIIHIHIYINIYTHKIGMTRDYWILTA